MKLFSQTSSGFFSHHREAVDVAIDIGTASVSAVIANRLTEGAPENQVRYETGNPLNQSFNLLDLSHGNFEARAWHVMNIALSKIFVDLAASVSRPRIIRLSFASLFFKEYTVKKTITREHPSQPISRQEVDGYIEAYAKEISEGKGMTMISSRLLKITVNGYHVTDAVGYTGDTIDCSMQYLFVSEALYSNVHDLLQKHFPSTPVAFYSDADILVGLVARTNMALPSLVIDVGGEATSCYTIFGDRTAMYHKPIYFGVRTLERRLAAVMHAEIDAAESVLRRFTAGSLHEEEWEKVQPTVDAALIDWWTALTKEVTDANLYASIATAGAGRDIAFFGDIVKKRAPDTFGVVTQNIFPLGLPLERFIPQKVFEFGGDMILGGLLLMDGSS